MLDELNELDFGKHNGETVEAVAESDILYLDWLNGQEWFERHYLYKTVNDVCETRMKEIEDLLEANSFGREIDTFPDDKDWKD